MGISAKKKFSRRVCEYQSSPIMANARRDDDALGGNGLRSVQVLEVGEKDRGPLYSRAALQYRSRRVVDRLVLILGFDIARADQIEDRLRRVTRIDRRGVPIPS